MISNGKEASSGLYCEYKYQPLKSVALKTISYSVSDIFFTEVSIFIGSSGFVRLKIKRIEGQEK